ncbi:MAG: S8 family peptidase [Parvibaculum sp.]
MTRTRIAAIAAGLTASCVAFAATAATYEYSPIYQNNLIQIGVTETLHQTLTGAGVGIAVFDSLADFNHVDLAGKRTTRYYPGTYTFFDFHGTHVSGIALGAANDAGIAGVAPGAWLHNYTVFDDDGWVPPDLGRAALDNVLLQNSRGANIKAVNMSYGPTLPGDVFMDGELAFFTDYKPDFVIVRAAGNDGTNARYEHHFGRSGDNLAHLLIVGSVDADNTISNFSNRPGNACIASRTHCPASAKVSNFFIVAPGRDILSDYPDQRLAWASGTSMAAPHVAGAVALIAEDGLNKNVALSPTKIASIIKESATELGAPGVDGVYGWGLLNVPAALAPVGVTTVATGAKVTSAKIAQPSRLRRSRFSRRGVGDPSLLDGLVVFDAFGRPFETDAASLTEPASRPLSRRGLAVLGLVSRQETMNFDDADRAVLAWTATGLDGQPTSAIHMIADGYELNVGLGAPEIFLAELPSANRAAAPQRFSQVMFSSLGEAGALFDNAMSVSFRAPLSDRLDATFFGMTAQERTEDPYAPVLLENSGETNDDSRFAALGLSYRIAEGWSLGASYAALHERGTVAGIESGGAFSLGEQALTQFQGMNLAGDLNENYSIGAFYTRASIDSYGTAGSLFDAADGWTADHYGATFAAKNVLHENSLFRFSLVKPLQITGGTVSARVPVGREFDGTVNYAERQSAFDGRALPVEARFEYFAETGAGTFGLALDVVDTNLRGEGERGLALGAGFSFAF